MIYREISFLKFNHPFIKAQRTQKRFAAMPYEEDLRSRLRPDIFPYEFLKEIFVHMMTGLIRVESGFFEVIAISA